MFYILILDTGMMIISTIILLVVLRNSTILKKILYILVTYVIILLITIIILLINSENTIKKEYVLFKDINFTKTFDSSFYRIYDKNNRLVEAYGNHNHFDDNYNLHVFISYSDSLVTETEFVFNESNTVEKPDRIISTKYYLKNGKVIATQTGSVGVDTDNNISKHLSIKDVNYDGIVNINPPIDLNEVDSEYIVHHFPALRSIE